MDPAMRPDAAGLVEELEGVAAELAAVEGVVSGAGERKGGVGAASERQEGARVVGGVGARAGASAAGGATVVASTVERRERWRWRAIYAVGVFGVLYVGFLIGVMVVGAEKVGSAAMAKTEAAREQGPSMPASAPSVPAAGVRRSEDERPAVKVLPETPRAVLEVAVPALRGCASMAGEAVMVEVSSEVGSEVVAKSEVLGHDADEVGACVRTVAAGLRFAAPMKAETITKEVKP
ncbi:MAG TPA: hypothetical protein PKW35_16605 [Nannocystaceae bacterium]|nr:hypothetical protein [Nannocystaceae bacterium]